ncbi:MAG: amidohydrolase family protein [Terriglobia bacterium]
MTSDIVLRRAHVIDPSQGIAQVLDVAVRGGIIAEVGPSLVAPAATAERDLSGAYVCPGLIDLHGHWYEGSAWGIDPDFCLDMGASTVVDAGTTGFINFPDFLRHGIIQARVRVLAFVNIAAWGIPTSFAGELEDLRYSRPRETIAVLEENPGLAIGVKVRMKEGHSPKAFDDALETAEKTKLPLMVHIGKGARTAEILRRLRPGDIVTHCFEGRGDGIVDNGSLIPEARQARQEGVVFDVGHGAGSFSWEVARRAFEYEFYPDTISTDLHRYSVERWAFDMPTTMTKFLHLGMSLQDVVLKSAWNPAKVIGRERELGTLRVGTVADLFAFTIEEGAFPLEDTHLKIEVARRRIKPLFLMKSGEIIEPHPRSGRLRKLYEADYEMLRSIERSA